jgi:hypothetical protein
LPVPPWADRKQVGISGTPPFYMGNRCVMP